MLECAAGAKVAVASAVDHVRTIQQHDPGRHKPSFWAVLEHGRIQARQPVRRRNRVVVEKRQHSPARRASGRVIAASKAKIAAVVDDPHGRKSRSGEADRSVSRPVVDEQDFK